VRKTIVGEIYRIPNNNSALSFDRYDTILSKLSNSQNIIIGGDLNFDFLKTDTHIPTTNVLYSVFTNAFVPTITKLTPITHSRATLTVFCSLSHKETKLKS